MQSITIGYGSGSAQSNVLKLAAAGDVNDPLALTSTQSGTDGASLVANSANLSDLVFSSNALTISKSSQRLTGTTDAKNLDEKDFFEQIDAEEELTAVDKVLQAQDSWLDRHAGSWLT